MKIPDKCLFAITKEMCLDDIYEIGLELEVGHKTIQQIIEGNPHNVRLAAFDVLRHWRDEMTFHLDQKGAVQELTSMFGRLKRNEMGKQLKKSMHAYQKHLQSSYQSQTVMA